MRRPPKTRTQTRAGDLEEIAELSLALDHKMQQLAHAEENLAHEKDELRQAQRRIAELEIRNEAQHARIKRLDEEIAAKEKHEYHLVAELRECLAQIERNDYRSVANAITHLRNMLPHWMQP